MNTLRELLVINSQLIPEILERKLATSIEISESNENEVQIEGPLRVLIRSIATGVQSAHEAIHIYLNALETQNSATREVFEDMEWNPPVQDVQDEDDVQDEELEEGEIREVSNDTRARFQAVDDFLNMFPARQ